MMDGATEWTIEYYVDDQGGSPVGEFLRGLDNKTFRRFEWSLEQLRLRNVTAREPLVKHVDGKIWELREESSTNIYRLLYFFFRGRRIVLLHGFAKKGPKLPRQELEIARRRQARFDEREGGD
jgi:phage-related protein